MCKCIYFITNKYSTRELFILYYNKSIKLSITPSKAPLRLTDNDPDIITHFSLSWLFLSKKNKHWNIFLVSARMELILTHLVHLLINTKIKIRHLSRWAAWGRLEVDPVVRSLQYGRLTSLRVQPVCSKLPPPVQTQKHPSPVPRHVPQKEQIKKKVRTNLD